MECLRGASEVFQELFNVNLPFPNSNPGAELRPTFRVSGVIRDFLVTGNIIDYSTNPDTETRNRVQRSGLNDITSWTPWTKQAYFQDLPGSGGQVVAITSGEYGYVFRQNEIIRMDYVGGATVFRFSVISPNRGATFGKTVCQDNRRAFFYADDGFFEVNGDQVKPIGAEKVNRFFDGDLNLKSYETLISGNYDMVMHPTIMPYHGCVGYSIKADILYKVCEQKKTSNTENHWEYDVLVNGFNFTDL